MQFATLAKTLAEMGRTIHQSISSSTYRLSPRYHSDLFSFPPPPAAPPQIRLLERSIRRARVPVAYNNGMHSRPRMSTALALPLGATSTCELVDMELSQKVELSQLEESIQAVFGTYNGLRLEKIEQVPLYIRGNDDKGNVWLHLKG